MIDKTEDMRDALRRIEAIASGALANQPKDGKACYAWLRRRLRDILKMTEAFAAFAAAAHAMEGA